MKRVDEQWWRQETLVKQAEVWLEEVGVCQLSNYAAAAAIRELLDNWRDHRSHSDDKLRSDVDEVIALLEEFKTLPVTQREVKA